MPAWKSKEQVERALKRARQEYKKAHDKMLDAVRAKKDQKTIEKLQKKSDEKLKACKDLQHVLDRWY